MALTVTIRGDGDEAFESAVAAAIYNAVTDVQGQGLVLDQAWFSGTHLAGDLRDGLDLLVHPTLSGVPSE